MSDLWDKCYFGPAQREEFSPAFDGMCSQTSHNYDHDVWYDTLLKVKGINLPLFNF